VATIVERLREAGCVFAEDEAALLLAAAESPASLETMVFRRAAGEPLELVLGYAVFCGLRIALVPGVFVPRLRTEHLVREAAALASAGAVVVDLCCGTGALGAALLSVSPDVSLSAADIDPLAIACASSNLGPQVPVYRGDLFDALPAALCGQIDLLLANTPYVPTTEIPFLPAEAREYEHLVALDGGSDGLDVQRRVAVGAALWLAPGGHVLVEVSDRQAAAALAIFSSAGLVPWISTSVDLDATVLMARRP
jgi:release factor glutamine methyltransferase